MVYSVHTDFATQDEAIPESCLYQVHKQPAGSGRIGFRVDYDGCGTGSKLTNGLYPRLLDHELRTPTLEVAYQQLLWKSRLSGPFVSIWRSWARALRWARYLKKRNCHGIMIHAIDLDVVGNPIYDASKVVKELQNRNRALELAPKNHHEELILYNGTDDSTCANIASIPAGSDNVKVAAHFANVLIPKEFYEEVEKYVQSQAQQQQVLPYAVQSPAHYGTFWSAESIASIPAGNGGTFFDSVLSRLYLGTIMRRGYVDKAKLLQLIIAMCTDFARDGKMRNDGTASSDGGSVIGSRPRTDSIFTTLSSSTFVSVPSPITGVNSPI